MQIWITGASSGIGTALLNAYAGDGHVLVISSRNETKLNAIKSEFADSSSIHVVPIDLEDHKGIDTQLEKYADLLCKTDILINNAGISQRSLAKETDWEVNKKLMDVNYLGTLKLTQWLLPFMLKRNAGNIAVISSMAGKFGTPLRSGYCASKFALQGYFESLQAELSDTGINITLICPGFIQTDISKNALIGNGEKQNSMDEATANGMPVDKFAFKAIRAIENQRPEAYIGGFYETKFALLMKRLFPSLFRKILSRSKVV